jgi:transposase
MGYMISRDDGWRMPDWLWEKIEPLLPAPPFHPLGCHNPRVPDRNAMEAILLVLRTGMQWNALDVSGICSSSSAHRRFQEWRAAGVFHEIWRQGLLAYDEAVGIDWSWLAADGAMAKAPLGGPKTGLNPTDRAKKGETIGPHRGEGRPGRTRARGREPQRPPPPEGHVRLDPDRAPQADPGSATGAVPRQGVRQRRDPRHRGRLQVHAAHPRPRRRDRREGPYSRLARPTLGRRGQPQLAQP